jgi:hypothetical protein
MAELSLPEQRKVEAGARQFVRELEKSAPAVLAEGVAGLGRRGSADPDFLRRYTANLGDLATAKFSDALQRLFEEDLDEAGLLQSAEGGSIGHFVLKSFQKRLCNPQASADLKVEIAKVRKEHGLDINPTAASISGSAATAVALSVGMLIGSGPLAIVLAPLAGAVALLLLLVGVDTFCAYASKGDAPLMPEPKPAKRKPAKPRTAKPKSA